MNRRFADVAPTDGESKQSLKLKVSINKVDDSILSDILQHLRKEVVLK